MNFLLYRNTLLKIRKSLGRYISLLIIVMVGVGFYAGIQITAPNIVNVADSYYKDFKFMDFKIVSSRGLTDDDVDVLMQLEGVLGVFSSFSLDVQSRGNVVRVHAIEDNVNIVKLLEGRMPLLDKECVADSRKYSVGDVVEVTGDVEGKIKNAIFTVVGLVDSVLYLHDDYGSTNVGNGHLSSFIFVNKTNFVLDVYTEIYVVIETGNAVAYSEEYVVNSRKFNDEIVEIKSDREAARFNEIFNAAMKIIEEKESELNSEIEKVEKEFKNAKRALDENIQKLQNAKNELDGNEAELKESIKMQTAEFNLLSQQIADAWEDINSSLLTVGVSADEINVKILEMELTTANIQVLLDDLTIGSSEYVMLYTDFLECLMVLDNLKQIETTVNMLRVQENQLNEGIEAFNVEIGKALKEIENAKNVLGENEKSLNNGFFEFYEKNEQFNVKIVNAKLEIEDAKNEVLSMKRPQWHIFDRSAAAGYDALDSGIQIVAVVATVFPLFFILISILMTSNSMSRMITEERGEIGTLTSLGYKDREIIFSYMLYVLSASGFGAVIGFFIGCRVFPPLIYANFTFILPPLVLGYNIITLGGILLITFALMFFVTLITCNRELKQKPASLMRPCPPKHGQQIFLERATFVWKRLSFTWKVTIRNMFRYKKRAFMTIVGVAGCASLLLIAFGVYDGMSGMAQKQYGDILRYDNMIILKDETQALSGELKTLFEEQQVIAPLLIRQSAYKCESNKKMLDAFLIVPQNNELFEHYFNLKSTINKKNIVLNDNDVVITQRIAVVYNFQKGDILTIKDLDNNVFNLYISDIAENYASNYIYINTVTYNEVFEKPITFNAIVSNHNIADETALAEILIDNDYAVNVIFTNDTIEKTLDSTKSLNGVIIFIVIIAAILNIIVLYNLTAINISERTREIATLKVLGFRDSETNAYIYREAILLTIISIGTGIVLGVVLHHAVINIIESNALSLSKNIKWTSYVMACTITLIFALFMQVITYFKLKKIDMIGSLKSVE